MSFIDDFLDAARPDQLTNVLSQHAVSVRALDRRTLNVSRLDQITSTPGNLVNMQDGGISFISREFPSITPIQWVTDDDLSNVGKIMGWYATGSISSGLYIIGRARNGGYGVSGLVVQTDSQTGSDFTESLELNTKDGGRAVLTQVLGSIVRQSRLPAEGWQKYAMMQDANPSMTFSGNVVLAANGGAIAIPILLHASMLLESVSFQSNDTASARKWAWYLYKQNVNNESDPSSAEWTVAASCAAPFEFTPTAASLRSIDAGNAPVFLAPGQYWLVIQNQHATNTINVGYAAGGTNLGWTCLQNTLTNPLPLTPFSFQAGVWTKLMSIIGVRLNGMLDHHFLVADVPMSGTDESTTFTDNEGSVWTANGNAQIDTSLGDAYGLFDGTGDYLSTADSIRWRLDDGLVDARYRIEFDVRFNGDPGTGTQGFLSQRVDDNNFWGLIYQNNTLTFTIRSGGASIVNAVNAWNPATATTYKVTVVKDGSQGYSMYIDDVQIGTTVVDVDVMPDFAASLVFGNHLFGGINYYFNGWARNLKIKKGTIT